MIWGYIELNNRTIKHIGFYTEHRIPHLVKNNRIYIQGNSFLDTLKISSRSVGKNRRVDRLVRNQSFLTYCTKVQFDGKDPVFGIVAAQKLGHASALMMNPLKDWSEVIPRGLIGL